LSAAWDVVGGTDTGAVVVEAAEVVAGLTVVAGAEVVAPEPQEARIRTQEMRTPRVASTHFPFTDGLLIKFSLTLSQSSSFLTPYQLKILGEYIIGQQVCQ
jgi:hypothetical protein